MSSNETVAAIDVGSNSIKLLVARPGEAPRSIETVFTETIETRISAGISRELPSLTDQAISKGTATIAELFRLAQAFSPRELRIVATSAVRDALNGQDFIEAVQAATGLTIRILSGTEEATLIGKGLACDPAIAQTPRFIQMDIGGGSLELIRFNQGRIEHATSLQLGAVRLTERFIEDRDRAIDAQTEARIQAHVHAELAKSGFPFEPNEDPLIATGGAFSVTRAVLAAEAGTTIDNFRAELTQADISTLKAKLAQMTLHDRMAVPHLPASRADIVPTALMTIETVLEVAQRDRLTHSFYNLRYGLVAEMLGL
jgi:exopolyphosphatase/guanosine-5'-triphosphate,3'-diphosphate pyrophosphatase